MLNKVTLMGRLTKDPELRYTPNSGLAVARYTLAVDRNYQKDKQNREADFINIVVFNKPAEFASQYFKKGRQVVVTGRLQTGSYTDKDGRKVYTTDVIAEEQYFAESKPANDFAAPTPQFAPSNNNFVNPVNNDEPDFSDGDIGFSLSEEDEKNLPF